MSPSSHMLYGAKSKLLPSWPIPQQHWHFESFSRDNLFPDYSFCCPIQPMMSFFLIIPWESLLSSTWQIFIEYPLYARPYTLLASLIDKGNDSWKPLHNSNLEFSVSLTHHTGTVLLPHFQHSYSYIQVILTKQQFHKWENYNRFSNGMDLVRPS